MIVVISLDGVCHEDLDLKQLPSLKWLAEQGVYTKRLRVTFPSITWNNHSSAMTGKGTDRHGVLGGRAYSRSTNTEFGYYEPHLFDIISVPQPTIFEKAAEKGKISAAVCWPLTQGNPHIKYNIPECYKQDYFNDFSTPEFSEELLAHGIEFNSYADWSNDHRLGPLQDDLTCRITEYLITHKPVDVLFTHFLIHDSFLHKFGIHTPESAWSLRYIDSLVRRIIDSLRSNDLLEKSHIIVMSDHGHEAINKYFDLTFFLEQQGIPNKVFHCVDNAGAVLLYFRQNTVPGNNYAGLCAALEECEAVEIACSVEQADKLLKLGLNSQAHPDTFPDIIIGLNHGWLLDTDNNRAYRGSHGYLPETHPRMDGFMIRAGESFQKGIQLDFGHICDVYSIIENLVNV